MPRFGALAARISMLAVLFGGEALVATLLLDGATPVPKGAWLAALIHTRGAWVSRFGVAFSALFATFAFLRYKAELKSLSAAAARDRIRWSLLAAHFAAIGLFSLASTGVYGDRLPAYNPNLVSAVWIFAAAAAIVSAALAFLPWQVWSDLRRITGSLWVYAAAAAGLTCAAASTFRSLWGPASRATFHMVQLFLTPFVRDMVIQPAALRIGTHRFTVVIANECSGLEGIGLLLVFGFMWLVLFRNEARFPQALVLLPLGIVTLFLLNAFRITALILIGNAGARDIAAEGFHSQAGWIAFNSVAFGSSIVARRWSWVSTRAASQPTVKAVEQISDPTAAYLVPFLAILAAGMISRASSGAFEWMYPLRFLAALAALWVFRRSYSHLDWNWSMLAPAAGIAVFLVWIAADRFTGAAMPMPQALAGSAAWVRNGWIALRILGAVFTVPIAEELAFRGFLLRRFTGADFDSIPFRSTTWLAVLGSSVLFGLMHGGRWWLGTIAGVIYALLIRRTGRIGDAVVAHSLTNALLALSVLSFSQWQLW
jgi:exosortase E/protease (VPEID-CTERM system)